MGIWIISAQACISDYQLILMKIAILANTTHIHYELSWYTARTSSISLPNWVPKFSCIGSLPSIWSIVIILAPCWWYRCEWWVYHVGSNCTRKVKKMFHRKIQWLVKQILMSHFTKMWNTDTFFAQQKYHTNKSKQKETVPVSSVARARPFCTAFGRYSAANTAVCRSPPRQ